MSDRGGKFPKWVFLLVFVGISPWIGMFIDTRIIFPPNEEVHGHGIPIFTILIPMAAVILSGVFLLIAGIRKVLQMTSDGKQYEYLKLFRQSNDRLAPVVILHEIDLNAGRCSVRCIQIYRSRYVECFQNTGFYVPIPHVQSFNDPFQVSQRAFITGRQEFEEIWNSRLYSGPLVLSGK